MKPGPSAASSARACASVPSTSGDLPPMSAYFSAEEGARRRLMSRAKQRPEGAEGGGDHQRVGEELVEVGLDLGQVARTAQVHEEDGGVGHRMPLGFVHGIRSP